MSAEFQDRHGWIPRFGAGRECIPIERFDRLGPADRAHAAHCLRCQAELALWRQFIDGSPAPDEGAAVNWVARELRRRFAAAPGAARGQVRWRFFGIPRLAVAAAGLVAVIVVGDTVGNREPRVPQLPPAAQQYRKVGIEAIAPKGEVDVIPRAIEWVPVEGAAVYDIEVFEVDRTTLWRGSSPAPRIELPPSLRAQFTPGKAVFWVVKARSVSGTIVAESGAQRFRVSP